MPYETHVTSLIRVAGLAACVLLFCAAAGCTTATETPSSTATPTPTSTASIPPMTTARTTTPAPPPTTVATGSTAAVTITDLNCKNEWVKIKNTGTSPVSLTGWRISDEGTKHTYTFPSFTLAPGATVTLHTGDGTNSATDLYWGSKRPIWNNDGDTASLYDRNGRLVDSLERRG
mgnify:CR=1 FL=1